MKRRDFIKNNSIAAASVGFAGLQLNEKKKMDHIFVHHVYFWLKEPENKESVKKFEEALNELVSIENIHMYHVGKPATTRRDVIESSYQYSLLAIFIDKKSHDIYQNHPKHDDFRKINNELSSKVIVYDSIDLV